MVLLVKLKNPNRKPIGGDGEPVSPRPADTPTREGEPSQQSGSPTEHHSPPPLGAPNDDALEELSAALQQTQIARTEVQGAEAEEDEKRRQRRPRPAVDVLLAPAVLGHRWVRTRSSSFVVERPERVRAVALGVAAVVAKYQHLEERPSGQHVDTLASHLASLHVDTSISPDPQPLSVFVSEKNLSLSQPSAALKMIHALEEEYLSLDDQGQPSPFATDKGESAATTSSLSYSSFLDRLCSQAPSEVPPPLAPRSMRSFFSPGGKEASMPDEAASGSHPSEVPLHLPQGDLYLCGPRTAAQTGYFDKQQSGDDAPQTPDAARPVQTEAMPEGEAAWLREGSRGAIEAALGTACAAVDRVVCAAGGAKLEDSQSGLETVDVGQLHHQASQSVKVEAHDEVREPALRSFVLVRPPGHHCNATQPSGFCWVNNVAVMAAHAYEEHGIDRVAILDFDLHHGNGTQAIAWRINADTVRCDLEREARIKAMRTPASRYGPRSAVPEAEGTGQERELGRRGLKVFYGSLHDIESFPCEDGNKELVTDASLCIEGAHGQWIWNVHLDSQTTADEAEELYRSKYSQLIDRARRFFAETDSSPASSLVLISAGFDACVHEQGGMQRHGKNVPPRFYESFTKDAVALADEWCQGKCISVLEGGYSDRALTSGTIAHLIGMGAEGVGPELYQPSSLYQLEKVSKAAFSVQARRKNDALSREAAWLDFTLEAFRRLEERCGRKRVGNERGTTAPETPNRAMMDQLWKSPRETRSSAKASPAK